MTTGEKLVEMSTLLTGTAQDHLLNISYGGGGGVVADEASDYLERKLAELFFMNLDFAGIGDQGGIRGSVIVGNFYMALFLSTPGEGGSLVNEATYGGYGRVPIVRGNTGWEYKDGSAKNIPVITWQPSTSGINVVTHFAVMDSLIGGNVLFYGELPDPVTINPGDGVEFDYNRLAIKYY